MGKGPWPCLLLGLCNMITIGQCRPSRSCGVAIFNVACVAWRFCRKHYAKTRANERRSEALFPPQSPHDFSALARLIARLYYLAHPTKTAMLSRGGRKGGLKTAKPHRNTPKNRKPHRIFTRIPKPRVQVGHNMKADVSKTCDIF